MFQPTQNPGFLLSLPESFQYRFEAAAVTAIGTLIFSACGQLSVQATAAEISPDLKATTGSIELSELETTTIAADLMNAPIEIQLDGILSFDCLVKAAPEQRQYCGSHGPFGILLFDPVSIPNQLQKITVPSSRLNLIPIQF